MSVAANVNDEATRDQAIGRCRDPNLRRKFLAKANAILMDLQDVARLQKAVNMQVRATDQSGSSSQVNALSFGKSHNKGKGKRVAQSRNRGNKPGKHSCGLQESQVMGCFRHIMKPTT